MINDESCRSRLIERYRNDPWLVGFELAEPVTLLRTDRGWPLRAGGNQAINSGSRARARRWSRKIYRSFRTVQGIWYPSSLSSEPCVALYERAAKGIPGRPVFNDSLASPKLAGGLSVLSERIGYLLK